MSQVVALRGNAIDDGARERQEIAVNLAGLLRRGFVSVGDRRITINFAQQVEADGAAKLFALNKQRKRKPK